MNIACDGLDVFEWRRGQNPVAQIEDMANPPCGMRQHIVGRPDCAVERTEQYSRIEVALHGAIEPDAHPRFVQRCPPIDADYGPARLTQLTEDGARADAEVNGRYAVTLETLEDVPRM